MSKREDVLEILTCVQDGSISVEDAYVVMQDLLAPQEGRVSISEYRINLSTDVVDTHMLVWTIEPKGAGSLMIKGLAPYAPLIKLKDER